MTMAADPVSPVAVSAELQTLHRLLLHGEALAHGLSTDPHKLMSAALGDERLVWLMPFIRLIAALDAADEAGEIGHHSHRAHWRQRIEDHVGPAPDADGRLARLRELAELSTDIANSEARLRNMLTSWPPLAN